MTPTLAPPPGSRSPGTSTPPSTDSSSRDSPLTILLVHNFYQKPGGEDGVFEREGAILEDQGHRVLRYTLHNDDVEDVGKLTLLQRAFWSKESYREVRSIVEDEGVDVVHVHNTLPLASPSVFHAAHDGGAATVHTLHNYRLVCPGNLLFRDGKPCTDCVGKSFAVPGIRHACYRGSHAETAVLAGTVAFHRRIGTWEKTVDRYIALSEFGRRTFIEGGIPPGRIAVKHNMPGRVSGPGAGGDFVLFAGRLAKSKGIGVLLRAWASDETLPPLRICGDGPLADQVADATRKDDRIDWLGWQSGDDVDRLMGEAAALIVPSKWYEGWPLVIVEAMGRGTPVIATDHGVFPEMIDDGETGQLFELANPDALAAAVHDVCDDPVHLRAMRDATWATFERRYAREVNYRQLRQIYADAIAQAASSRSARRARAAG